MTSGSPRTRHCRGAAAGALALLAVLLAPGPALGALKVSFIQPQHGAAVQGRCQVVLATSDGQAQRVSVEAAGIPLRLQAAPATFTWDSSGLVNGEYELAASAVGEGGRAYAVIRVQVQNPTQEQLRAALGLYFTGKANQGRAALKKLAASWPGTQLGALAQQVLAQGLPAPDGPRCLQGYQLSPAKEWWAAYTVTVRNQGKQKVSGASLVCSFLGDHQPDQVVQVYRTSPLPSQTSRLPDGAPVLHFALGVLAPGEAREVRIVYRLLLATVEYAVAQAPAGHWEGLSLLDYCRFTAPERMLEAEAPEMRAKAAELCQGRTTPAAAAAAISEFVTKHCVTEGDRMALTALEALRTGRAVCQGQSDLFVALCRAAGIPAQTVHGPCLGEPGTAAQDRFPTWHQWAQVYLPGQGWVPWEYGLGKKGNWHGHFWLSPCLPGAQAIPPFHWKAAGVTPTQARAVQARVHFRIGPEAQQAVP